MVCTHHSQSFWCLMILEIPTKSGEFSSPLGDLLGCSLNKSHGNMVIFTGESHWIPGNQVKSTAIFTGLGRFTLVAVAALWLGPRTWVTGNWHQLTVGTGFLVLKTLHVPPQKVDWFKGKSSPETIDFSQLKYGIFPGKPIHWPKKWWVTHFEGCKLCKRMVKR